MKNKWLFDLLPVILFFVAFRLADIYVATAVAIATSAAQIGWLLIRRRPIDTMQWVGLVIIVVFGGMTQKRPRIRRRSMLPAAPCTAPFVYLFW